MAIFFESLITNVLVAAVTLIGIIYWFFNKNFDYWEKRNIPYCKPQAFFGNFKDRLLGRRPIAEIWVDLYNELKDEKLGGAWFMKRPLLFIRDPDLIRRVLVKDFSHFQDRGNFVDEENSPLSAHLFNLGGEKWRFLRAKLTPTFTSGKMKMMFALMHECAEEFVECVKIEARDKEEVEFREIFAKLTTDIIGTCAFGLQFNSLKNPDSEFRVMGRKIFTPSTFGFVGHMLFHIFPLIGKIVDVHFPRKEVSDFFIKAVQETVSYREKNQEKRNDFLQLLIDLKNKINIEDDEHDATITTEGLPQESGDKEFEMTNNLLAAQAFVFFLAGFETSSTTMSFVVHELTMNPDIQTKLRSEIDDVLKKNGGEFTYESIKQMVYLDKVISESLRKYPPISTLMRKCNKDYQDPDTGFLIEKGTRIEIPVYALHHDPQYYPDPEKFNPERFSEEEKAKRPHYVYLPFGDGPRVCIGMRFGLLQAKLGLAMLLSRFKLSTNEPTTLPRPLNPKAFITSFKGGVYAHVTPLSPTSTS